SHIAAAGAEARGANIYFQQRVAGHAVSAAFVANGRSARVLGFSEQWTAGDGTAMFRYGGCVGPLALPAALRAAAIVYAPQRLVIPAQMVWPSWSADRGADGTIIDRGEPVCTVRAEAATTSEARARAEERGARLLAQLAAGRYPDT